MEALDITVQGVLPMQRRDFNQLALPPHPKIRRHVQYTNINPTKTRKALEYSLELNDQIINNV